VHTANVQRLGVRTEFSLEKSGVNEYCVLDGGAAPRAGANPLTLFPRSSVLFMGSRNDTGIFRRRSCYSVTLTQERPFSLDKQLILSTSQARLRANHHGIRYVISTRRC
jgi:hypothetical protein